MLELKEIERFMTKTKKLDARIISASFMHARFSLSQKSITQYIIMSVYAVYIVASLCVAVKRERKKNRV